MIKKVTHFIKYMGAIMLLAFLTGGPFIIALYWEALRG